MNSRLSARLLESCTLVPTRRYARALEESYNRWQISRRLRTWARPTILTLSEFVLDAAEQSLAASARHIRILTPEMQRTAFLKLAPNSILGAHNWYPEVEKAWHLSHHYPLEAPEDAHLETSNTFVFQDWAEAFRSFAEELGYLTESELAQHLIKELESGNWVPEQRIILWGFGQAHPLTPCETELVNQLERRKLIVDRCTPAPLGGKKTLRIVEFEQPEDELRTIALWARGLLEKARKPISIGIAFPSLSRRRHQVERQLTNTLYPSGATNPDEPRIFDLAGGIPLTTIPVCESGLLLLNFLYRDLSIHDLDRLLESPFMELDVRLPLPNELRRRLPTRIRAHDLSAIGRGAWPEALQVYSKPRRRKRTLRAWLAEFQMALEIARWPRPHTLDSLTYQHATQFTRLWREVASCSHLLAPMHAADAVLELSRAAHGRHHEVQRSGAPIRVLDIEDLVNLRFTHLWIAGMRNADWPTSTSANPFLSRLSQRKAKVPGITPESRLNRARSITQELPGLAREVIFSHSKFDGDEQHRPSALLPEAQGGRPGVFVAPARHPLLGLSHPYLQQPPIALDLFVDETAPECDISERQGNADLVRDQSNCPFRAFSRHRLAVRQASNPGDLPDARAVGSAIHLALETAYRELPSQADIKDHPKRGILARRSAEGAVRASMPNMPASLRSGLTRMIAQTIENWFACDLQRPAYGQLHTEHEIALELEGMLLRLKIDRFDQDLETGKWVITDYKSSPPSPSSLRIRASLHEPQLLLYAEALRESRGIEPVSLAFGAVGEPTNAGYSHCSADARFRKQAKERDLDGRVIEDSGSVVRKIVREYLSGRASVTPRKGACETCHLHSLCRVHSQVEA